MLLKISQEHWTAGSLWAIENLRKTSKNFAKSAAIARFAYSEIKDITYKNQILYFLRDTFSDKNEYRDFLISHASQANINYRQLRPIVELLAKQFPRDPNASRALLSFLSHEEADIRAICIPAVLSRAFFSANKEPIVTEMQNETSSKLRSIYSQYFCLNMLPNNPTLLFRADENKFHDYAVTIDDKIIETMVRGAMRSERRNAQQNENNKAPNAIDVKWSDVEKNIYRYLPSFFFVKQNGLPIKLNLKKHAA